MLKHLFLSSVLALSSFALTANEKPLLDSTLSKKQVSKLLILNELETNKKDIELKKENLNDLKDTIKKMKRGGRVGAYTISGTMAAASVISIMAAASDLSPWFRVVTGIAGTTFGAGAVYNAVNHHKTEKELKKVFDKMNKRIEEEERAQKELNNALLVDADPNKLIDQYVDLKKEDIEKLSNAIQDLEEKLEDVKSAKTPKVLKASLTALSVAAGIATPILVVQARNESDPFGATLTYMLATITGLSSAATGSAAFAVHKNIAKNIYSLELQLKNCKRSINAAKSAIERVENSANFL